MQRLEVGCAVRRIYTSEGAKGLKTETLKSKSNKENEVKSQCKMRHRTGRDGSQGK